MQSFFSGKCNSTGKHKASALLIAATNSILRPISLHQFDVAEITSIECEAMNTIFTEVKLRLANTCGQTTTKQLNK